MHGKGGAMKPWEFYNLLIAQPDVMGQIVLALYGGILSIPVVIMVMYLLFYR